MGTLRDTALVTVSCIGVACGGSGDNTAAPNEAAPGVEQESGVVGPAADATVADVEGGNAPADAGAPVTTEAAVQPPADAGRDVADVFVPNDGAVTLTGRVQKGPFILGSTVTISAIDGSGTPTGQVFTTQTSSDLGDFAVTFAYRGAADIQAQGFYYDEVTGALSGAPLTLRALYQISNGGPQAAHVNVFTHLAHDRALDLVADGGTSLAAAEAQAEQEVVAALGIGGKGFVPSSPAVALDELSSGDDSNAYLLALGAVLLQAATEQAGDAGSVDAQLQELLDTLSADLAHGGPLPSALVTQLRNAEQDLDVDLTMDLLERRLQAIGSAAAPANLNAAIDTDGDGYRNSIDTCPLVPNPDQTVIPVGVLCKVTRHTTPFPSLPAGSGIYNGIVGAFQNGQPHGLLRGDIHTQGMTSYSAGFFSNDGAGRFGSSMPVSFEPSCRPQTAFDVNQDGNLDLVVTGCNRPDGGTLLQGYGYQAGDGAGNFGALSFFPDPAPGPDGGTIDLYYPNAPAFADFNGDQRVDIARIGTLVDQSFVLTVSMATSAGVFAAPFVTPLQVAVTPFHPSNNDVGIWADDVNGDGKQDLAVAVTGYTGVNDAGNTNYVTIVEALLGDGSGAFQPQSPVIVAADFNWSTFADFDGDKNMDVAGFDGRAIYVTFGDGTGQFSSPVTTAVTDALDLPTGRSSPLAADVNGDGKADLIGNGSGAIRQSVILSFGRTFASPQRLRTTPLATSDPSGLQEFANALGDLNGDGIPDVLLLGTDAKGNLSAQSLLMNVQK